MKPISRRTVLRGLGTAMALPLLECMPAARALGSSPQAAESRLRMAFLVVPNGAHMPQWTPSAEGRGFQLPPILEPLAPVKDKLLVLTGLAQDLAAAHGDGAGDHARSASCFLTGAHPRKTSGANIRVGVSVDQVAAQKMSLHTRFPSLELGIERGGNSGDCDSGYSCAYSSNVSWRTEATPSSKEINPRLVFERLFASGDKLPGGESPAMHRRYKQSILDTVAEDASGLRKRLGGADQQKLDEYLTGVRELELRMERTGEQAMPAPSNFARPGGIPTDYREHARLMCDLMVLAFQADLTRVCTFMLANEGSNRSYPSIGISEGHHELSHHGRSQEKQAKIAKINRFHIEQFAYLLERLQGTGEGEQTLLDKSMIVYGSGIGDGDRHNHDDLPILLAGRGGGTLDTGRHIRYRKTPLNNLYLSMLDRIDAGPPRLGDSTGRLDRLSSETS